jgi:hypothetical protein
LAKIIVVFLSSKLKKNFEYGVDPQQIFGETERGDKIMNKLEGIESELAALKSEIEALKKLIQSNPNSLPI